MIDGIRANQYVNLERASKTDIMAMKPGQCRTTLWLADLHQIQTSEHISTQFGSRCFGYLQILPWKAG